FCGTISSGSISVGDEITVLPSRKTSKVKSIVNPTASNLNTKHLTLNTISEAYAPMATTITLEDEIDISRGDMIVKSDNIPEVSDHLSCMVVWMDESPLRLNENYIIKRATSVINGTFETIEYKKNINTFEELDADALELNDIAKCTISLDRKIAVDPYQENRYTGSFIIIDKYTNKTVGAGMILDSIEGLGVRVQGSGVRGQRSEVRVGTEAKEYSNAEIELNKYIRKNYPEWECREI
ncbi:hypothetical protein M947_11740, partial [Sulfurimonas hongkongensis]